MQSYDETATKLDAYIRRVAGVPADSPELTQDTHIFDYGYVDSAGAFELIEFVEKTFAIEVSDADLASRPLNTIRQIANYVVERTTTGK